MIAGIPFVVGFLGDTKELTDLTHAPVFRVDQAVPPDTKVFGVRGMRHKGGSH